MGWFVGSNVLFTFVICGSRGDRDLFQEGLIKVGRGLFSRSRRTVIFGARMSTIAGQPSACGRRWFKRCHHSSAQLCPPLTVQVVFSTETFALGLIMPPVQTAPTVRTSAQLCPTLPCPFHCAGPVLHRNLCHGPQHARPHSRVHRAAQVGRRGEQARFCLYGWLVVLVNGMCG